MTIRTKSEQNREQRLCKDSALSSVVVVVVENEFNVVKVFGNVVDIKLDVVRQRQNARGQHDRRPTPQPTTFSSVIPLST